MLPCPGLEGVFLDSSGFAGSITLVLTSMSLMLVGRLKPWITFQVSTSLVPTERSKMSQFCLIMSPKIVPLGW